MKKISPLIIILLNITALALSCSGGTSFSDKITGKWMMTKVLELSEDVTEKHNPDNKRWIRFINDTETENSGTFESGAGDKTENTCKWFFNKKENELFLDSDADEDDDSYWEVSFKTDSMYWKGRKFEFNKRFEIFYDKTD